MAEPRQFMRRTHEALDQFTFEDNQRHKIPLCYVMMAACIAAILLYPLIATALENQDHRPERLPLSVVIALAVGVGTPLFFAVRTWWRSRARPRPGPATLLVKSVLVLGIVSTVATLVVAGYSVAMKATGVDRVSLALPVPAIVLGLLLALQNERSYTQDQKNTAHEYDRGIDLLQQESALAMTDGLHRLAALAQDAPEVRQKIIDRICTFIRNYGHGLGSSPTSAQLEPLVTAQQILRRNLKFPPRDKHWLETEINLAGARLWDFDLLLTGLRRANFREAAFHRTMTVMGAEISGDADFSGATFYGRANFALINTLGDLDLTGVTFADNAYFLRLAARSAAFTGATFGAETMIEVDSVQTQIVLNHCNFTGPFTLAARPGTHLFLREAVFGGRLDFEGIDPTCPLDLDGAMVGDPHDQHCLPSFLHIDETTGVIEIVVPPDPPGT